MTMRWLAFSAAACIAAGAGAASPDTVWVERTDTVWIERTSHTEGSSYMRHVSNYNRA